MKQQRNEEEEEEEEKEAREEEEGEGAGGLKKAKETFYNLSLKYANHHHILLLCFVSL